MSKTCAEVAAEFVTYSADFVSIGPNQWTEAFKECSDFPKPKQKKQVWQWRYLDKCIKDCKEYRISLVLLTEAEAYKYHKDETHYEKHAGPFEVDV